MDAKRYELPFFIAMFLGIIVVAFFIFQPFVPVLALAGIFAVILQPLYQRINQFTRDRFPSVAALLTVTFAVFIILGPISFLGAQVFAETRDLYRSITQNGTELMTILDELIVEPVRIYYPGFAPDLASYAEQALGWLASNLGQIFSGTIQTIVGFFLGCMALYYFLRDGKRFTRSFATLSPLTDEYDFQIQRRLVLAINSIVKGSLLVALLQGVLAGIGFAFFGIPSPALWGSLAAIGALVPGVGTTIIIVPAVAYLFFTGNTWQAAGLLIWGATAVGLIDNLLRPTLIGAGVRIHPLFVLFSVLGGITLFGPTGFLLGPLVLSLLYALLDIYRVLILKTEPHTKMS